jgi:hypothetical protein
MGFSTNITLKKFFLNFFLVFLGDLVPWYKTRRIKFQEKKKIKNVGST